MITPWKASLSSDIKIPVITDHVLTIITPLTTLLNLYVQTLEKYENRKFKSSPSSEQPENGDTDRGSDSGSGRPDCSSTEPFVINDDGTLSPWLLDVTNDNTFMILSDKILTLCDPTGKIKDK